MTSEEADVIAEQARQLAANLVADINNASTRIEHTRLSQLAAEAERLVAAIDILRG